MSPASAADQQALVLLRERFAASNVACRELVKKLKMPHSRASPARSRRAISPPPERLTSSPPHHLVISPPPKRPPFYCPPCDSTATSRGNQESHTPKRAGRAPEPRSSPRRGERSRPQSAHACTISREWRHAAQRKLPLPNPALDRVHTAWQGERASRWSLKTDAPWTDFVPQPTLFTPIPLVRSGMNRPASPCNRYGPRLSFALASMPASVSTRATLPPPADRRLGWVR